METFKIFTRRSSEDEENDMHYVLIGLSKYPETQSQTKAAAHLHILYIFLHILHKWSKYQHNREVDINTLNNRQNMIR